MMCIALWLTMGFIRKINKLIGMVSEALTITNGDNKKSVIRSGNWSTSKWATNEKKTLVGIFNKNTSKIQILHFPSPTIEL